MKITNLPGVARAWVSAAENDRYHNPAEYSATELIGPPRIAILKERHKDQIVEDIASLAYRLLGTGVHALLERAKIPGAITEERLVFPILDRTVGAQIDYAEPIEEGSEDYEIIDFKVAKSFGYIRWKNSGLIKPEWQKQLSVYAYALRREGVSVVSAAINQLVTDWSWSEKNLKRKQGYPPSELVRIDVPLMAHAEVHEFLEERMKLFEISKSMVDSKLPECTEEEQWASGSCWQVVWSEGDTTGQCVPKGSYFNSELQAAEFLDTKSAGQKKKRRMETRYKAAECVRCTRGYCAVRRWCNQYQAMVDSKPDAF